MPGAVLPAFLAALGCVTEPLVLTPEREHAHRLDTLSHRLAEHIGVLHSVERVSVMLDVAASSPYSHGPAGDRGRRSTASVVAAIDAQAETQATREAIVRIVAASLRDLDRDAITVVVSRASQPGQDARTGVEQDDEQDDLADVGPFRVAANSRRLLQVVGALLLLVIIALASWVVVAERSKASLRRSLAHATHNRAE